MPVLEVTIGTHLTNVTLSVVEPPRRDSDRFVEIFDAVGRVSVDGFQVEFRTKFTVPVTTGFRDKIRELAKGTSRSATFWGGLDHVPEVLIELRAGDADKVSAVVTFALSRSAPEQHLRLSDWAFEGQLEFGFEQSALAGLELSLDALLRQQRPRT